MIRYFSALYAGHVVETFGAPMEDADANRELFEEQFEIIEEDCGRGATVRTTPWN